MYILGHHNGSKSLGGELLTHKESKERYLRYRVVARNLFEDVGKIESKHIKIPIHANVQMCEDGAFVDAVVWIPKEKL